MLDKPNSISDSHEYFVSELNAVLDSLSDPARTDVLQACAKHADELLTEQQIDDAHHPALHMNQYNELQKAAKGLVESFYVIRENYPDLADQFSQLHQLIHQCSAEVVKEVIAGRETAEENLENNVSAKVDNTLDS